MLLHVHTYLGFLVRINLALGAAFRPTTPCLVLLQPLHFELLPCRRWLGDMAMTTIRTRGSEMTARSFRAQG